MNEPTSPPTEALLARIAAGDAGAQDPLYRAVRAELRHVAGGLMRDQADAHTLQPTALVHEAWIRMVGAGGRTYESKRHFLGVAAKAMRSVLVDHVRSKRASKRGGGAVVQEPDTPGGLDVAVARLEGTDTDLLDLEEALAALERDDPELARLVELRFFCGLPQPEVAAALGVSVSTVERMWRIARARLHRGLGREVAEVGGDGPLG